MPHMASSLYSVLFIQVSCNDTGTLEYVHENAEKWSADLNRCLSVPDRFRVFYIGEAEFVVLCDEEIALAEEAFRIRDLQPAGIDNSGLLDLELGLVLHKCSVLLDGAKADCLPAPRVIGSERADPLHDVFATEDFCKDLVTKEGPTLFQPKAEGYLQKHRMYTLTKDRTEHQSESNFEPGETPTDEQPYGEVADWVKHRINSVVGENWDQGAAPLVCPSCGDECDLAVWALCIIAEMNRNDLATAETSSVVTVLDKLVDLLELADEWLSSQRDSNSPGADNCLRNQLSIDDFTLRCELLVDSINKLIVGFERDSLEGRPYEKSERPKDYFTHRLSTDSRALWEHILRFGRSMQRLNSPEEQVSARKYGLGKYSRMLRYDLLVHKLEPDSLWALPRRRVRGVMQMVTDLSGHDKNRLVEALEQLTRGLPHNQDKLPRIWASGNEVD